MSRKDLSRKGKSNYWIGLLQTDKEFILSRVEVVLETRCWEWLGSISNDGYGKCKRNGKTYRGHRLSYSTFNGEIPQGMLVCHSCDNPLCVNPEHLWVGTHEENELDKTTKGRRSPSPSVSHPQSIPKGSRHHKSKIDEETAKSIYRLALRRLTGPQIKEELELDVHTSTIQRVINKGRWGNLNLTEMYGEINLLERRGIKLSSEDIQAIRQNSTDSPHTLSLKYGVCSAHIRAIQKGRKCRGHQNASGFTVTSSTP